MKKIGRFNFSIIISGVIASLAVLTLAACGPSKETGDDRRENPIKISFSDGNSDKPIELPVIGDSLVLRLDGLKPKEEVQILLVDDKGVEWSGSKMWADSEGRIRPFTFWYHSGVIGQAPSGIKIGFKPESTFETFLQAQEYFKEHALELIVNDARGRKISSQKIDFAERTKPMVYPSSKNGILMNSMNVREDPFIVSGKNIPEGSEVSIAVVENSHRWLVGDVIKDVSGKIETFKMRPDQTSFAMPAWDQKSMRPGAYDIIVRLNDDFKDNRIRPDDIVSYGDDTAVVLFAIINNNIVIDISGRDIPHPGKFEFNNSFEKGEDVWGGVDTTDVPPAHMGGAYAAYYVIDDEDPTFYDGVSPALVDVSGGHEVHRVKYWCLNGTRRLIWPNATQAAPIDSYDIVVDFGSTPAATLADYTPDNTYNKNYDFVDGYNTAGFYVFEDPSSVGTYSVATVDHVDENGITGMPFDTMGVTGPNYVIDLAWGRIMYPGSGSGSPETVDMTLTRYPIALFLHGRHAWCQSGGPPPTCPIADRVPSHQGYDYMMERLASQGIISVSIDALEIQPDNGIWNYDVRGRLILKWLDILRDWNDNGTDPFGGIFSGRLDMSKVALSGHSRGGEGVVAADVLNATWPNPHNILAINAIAPTDQNSLGGVSYIPTEAPYFLILGARDGDVSTMQGMRTYDRAYPDGMTVRHDKILETVYGANHNYFNTIWTDAAALGSPNPWVGAGDDGGSTGGVNPMSAAEQRQSALSSIAGFFRWHLQGFDPYKEIFTGRVKPSAMQNDRVFWTFQDKERIAVDNFEQTPYNAAINTLGGSNTFVGFTSNAETHFTNGNSDYTAPPPADTVFKSDTVGLKLEWASAGTVEVNLPGATGFDASSYTHFNIRAAKRVPSPLPAGSEINLNINVEDFSGVSANWDMKSEQWDPIPHPYVRNANQSILTGVRIPLRAFTQFDSGVNLSQLQKITISTEGSGTMGIDDIEFTK